MSRRDRRSGFTLLELMIVITIILILIGMATASYGRSVLRARETALKTDLKTMRTAIDTYTIDKMEPPQSLEQLRDDKYLREIPVDPITGTADWQTDPADEMLSPQQTSTGGIGNVHSASPDVSPNTGTAYKDW